ncbi:bifunctional ADP-dependent NAD(P)H-hydrate dehydratase/NAD(P)H-hydrate epimerase [Lewinellaceae bacterium SD302]|nr:bifunctional ADP-dependent NAD(P)H-hydrate dehydratase/NAD(P)H-hydrate epimerase [Lewinellaceae bacterium SD302]
MKIVSAKHLPALDQATIEAQNISSAQLMERAAHETYYRFVEDFYGSEYAVFCGSGNNGGDGWVLARLLSSQHRVIVYDCQIGERSSDNALNYQLAKEIPGIEIITVESADDVRDLNDPKLVVIDALFGSGLSRPVTGVWAGVIRQINATTGTVISIDLPSGVFADRFTDGTHVQANLTYSLGTPKLAEFAVDNAKAYGKIESVDIQLAAEALEAIDATFFTQDVDNLRATLKDRSFFDHKGTFGHALIAAGSQGKIGAATLCASAALRAGAGLVTAHLPRCGYEIAQIALPEAMCQIDRHRFVVTEIPGSQRYNAIGIGPGMGTNELTAAALEKFIRHTDQPLVLDADALNILSVRQNLLEQLPGGSILTPHPKEFARLFGETDNDFARWELLREKCQALNLVIVLKGGNTAIGTPDGRVTFNTNGNPGMGTGGTGDVLTGIITGLMAQGYPSVDAAKLGVYLHGSAGDLAATELEQESLLATDVIDHLGKAFRALRAQGEN